MSSPRILFILKRREDFDPTKHTKEGMQTGLYNSASFVANMLTAANVVAKMVIVIDNNDIDREVSLFKPTHVIIEALWVVPSKFAVLTKLHPTVKWIIRLHSEIPFLAQEGLAFDWLGDYATFPQIIIAANAPRALREVRQFISMTHTWSEDTANERIVYLPNYYPQQYKTKEFNYDKDCIDIGCFGAVRPLKNHMLQAYGALDFAASVNKKLNFHINARIELKADAIVNSLKGMFQHLNKQGHQLIFHTWTPREEFLQLCQTMDIGVQVSYSETFNIVGADFISEGIPLVGSYELPWMHNAYKADPTNSEQIANILKEVYQRPQNNVFLNQTELTKYTNETENVWLSYFKS